MKQVVINGRTVRCNPDLKDGVVQVQTQDGVDEYDEYAVLSLDEIQAILKAYEHYTLCVVWVAEDLYGNRKTNRKVKS